MFEYMIFAFIVANIIVLGAQVCHLVNGCDSKVTVICDSFCFDSEFDALLEINIFVARYCGEALRVSDSPKILKLKWSLISFN